MKFNKPERKPGFLLLKLTSLIIPAQANHRYRQVFFIVEFVNLLEILFMEAGLDKEIFWLFEAAG